MSKPDIFTEPDNVDPDTLTNLGPLRRLAGLWRADKGVDVNPKAEGPEHRVFIETVRMDPIDPQTNGPQLLYGLRYHVHINTPEEDITFHDQVGYWLWEPATGLIMQTLAIPRGQVLLAGGHAGPDDRKFFVEAKRGDTRYGICSTEFLEKEFRTDSYRIDMLGPTAPLADEHAALAVDHHDPDTGAIGEGFVAGHWRFRPGRHAVKLAQTA